MSVESSPISRALTYWRGRYMPTYVGLRRIADALGADSKAGTAKFLRSLQREAARHISTDSLLSFELYKDTAADGSKAYRECWACSPVLALVESIVLTELSRNSKLANKACVYSYRWNDSDSARTFSYFVSDYDQRISDIAAALAEVPEATVVLLDVASFYPSVTKSLVEERLTEVEGLSPQTLRLASLLMSLPGGGLPIGPALSHPLANMVLDRFDRAASQQFPQRYFRYVDDLAFVVPAAESAGTISWVETRLGDLGLQINASKTEIFSREEWRLHAPALRASVRSPRGQGSVSLDTCFQRARAFLDTNGTHGEERLRGALVAAGLSFPVHLLKAQVRRPGAAARILEFLRSRVVRLGFRVSGESNDLESLVADAITLRGYYEDRLEAVLRDVDEEKGRRWREQEIRRLVTRLCFLNPLQEYRRFLQQLPDMPAFLATRATLRAVIEARPGLVLPYSGAPAGLACTLWRIHGLPLSQRKIKVVSRRFSTTTLDLVFRGVVDGAAADVAKLAQSERRLWRAMRGEGSRRESPDFGFVDELQSLLLNTTLSENVAKLGEQGPYDEAIDIESAVYPG